MKLPRLGRRRRTNHDRIVREEMRLLRQELRYYKRLQGAGLKPMEAWDIAETRVALKQQMKAQEKVKIPRFR